jgi:uncharacterized membrane protein YeaQ/YmgE (transglycosylase-associated protein family)
MSLIIFLVVGLIAGAVTSYIAGLLYHGAPAGPAGESLDRHHRRASRRPFAGLLGLGAYNLIGEIIIATLGAILCIFVWQLMR